MEEPLIDQEVLRRLEQLAWISRKMSRGNLRGERRSRRRGLSAEFEDYRNYVPGDDLRFLDWKIYGRLERLFIKLFTAEEDLRLYVLLDVSRSMAFGEPEKLLYAKRVAAALGYISLSNMDTLAVESFAGKTLHAFGPCRGKGNAGRYFDFLSDLEIGEETSLYSTFRHFALTHRRRGIVVILSDFYDLAGYEEAFRQLFAGDFEVIALQILSPQEIHPDLEGDVKLVDVETGLTTDISMGERAMASYRKSLAVFSEELKSALLQRGGHYLLVSTEVPFDRLVMQVLRKRGLVR